MGIISELYWRNSDMKRRRQGAEPGRIRKPRENPYLCPQNRIREKRVRMSRKGTEEYRGELPSGLRWVHIRTSGRVAYAGVMLGIGSRDEQPSEWGVAHLIEHMLFKGTKRRSAFQVTNRVESVGGAFNAYTSSEETVLHAAFMPSYLARILELMADVVCNATFPAQELELERDVILEEYDSYEDSPAELIFDDFEELIFGDHPLAHSVLGTPERIEHFQREDILRFLRRYYTPSRMVVCTAGPFTERKVQSLIERNFSGVPHLGDTPRILKPVSTAAQSVLKRRDTTQAHCVIGGEALSLKSDRKQLLAFNLMLNILGGPASTCRLNRSLREKEGLAYTVETDRGLYLDTGTYTIYFGTDKQQVNRCVDIVLRELALLRATPLTGTQLRAAKRQFMGQTYLGMDSTESLMLLRARQVLEDLPAFSLDATAAMLEGITSSDIASLAEEFLQPERLFTVLYR